MHKNTLGTFLASASANAQLMNKWGSAVLAVVVSVQRDFVVSDHIILEAQTEAAFIRVRDWLESEGVHYDKRQEKETHLLHLFLQDPNLQVRLVRNFDPLPELIR